MRKYCVLCGKIIPNPKKGKMFCSQTLTHKAHLLAGYKELIKLTKEEIKLRNKILKYRQTNVFKKIRTKHSPAPILKNENKK